MVDPPLEGLRVLECGDTVAAAYAGRLLVDLGADVVLVEDVGGHPLRAVGPYLGGSPGRDRSAGFAYFAAGKRSLILDVTDASAAPRWPPGRTDVIIRATRDGRDWISDDVVAALTAADPGADRRRRLHLRPPGRATVPSQQRPAGAGGRRACCRSTPRRRPTRRLPHCGTGASCRRCTPDATPSWPCWARCSSAGAVASVSASTCRRRRRWPASSPPRWRRTRTAARSPCTTAAAASLRGASTRAATVTSSCR